MKQIKVMNSPVKVVCDTHFFILLTPYSDLHFSCGEPVVFEGKIFDTYEDAKEYLDKVDQTQYLAKFEIIEFTTF